METLGAPYPSFWTHDAGLVEQQRSFSVDRLAGLASESMHSELARSGSVVAELPPPASDFRVRDAGEEHVAHLPPARKLQKAGRERLRRDHLNEQFAKLADVLDPVRPKLDKGTILSESILAVNELRSDIARMKNERIALSDESRDLSQEKAELQEEKTALEAEVGRLQEQRNRSGDNQAEWRMDQAGPTQFPYPLMTKPSLPSKEVPQDPSSPFISASPHSAFLHPAYQTFGMFGSRQPPYSHFPQPGQQIHVERPAARYPAPIHPTPLYPAKSVPIVGTDLQLQTPGLTPSTTTEPEKTTPTKVGQGQEALGNAAMLQTSISLPSFLSLQDPSNPKLPARGSDQRFEDREVAFGRVAHL